MPASSGTQQGRAGQGAAASALPRVSPVEVPRPSSSRMISEEGVAAARMAAVSLRRGGEGVGSETRGGDYQGRATAVRRTPGAASQAASSRAARSQAPSPQLLCKGGAAEGQVVRGAHPRVHAVERSQAAGGGGHVRPQLRHDGDEGHLPAWDPPRGEQRGGAAGGQVRGSDGGGACESTRQLRMQAVRLRGRGQPNRRRREEGRQGRTACSSSCRPCLGP